MDVAAGGNVVVVFPQLGVIDDAAEFFLLRPPDQRVGKTLDAFLGNEVLGVALFEDLAGIDEEDLALALLRLGLVQKQHNAGGGGVVEEVLRQVEDALDQVAVQEPLADRLFLVGAGIARAAGGGAGVEDDGGAALVIEAGMDVLDPAPVGGGFAGETGPGGEAVEFVGIVVGLVEPVLVPHGIGDDAVEGAEFAAFVPELGVLEGVADLDLALHVVDDHVHVGHGPGLGGVFLAEQFERGGFCACGCLLHRDLAFHEEAAGTAGGVVDFHARLGLEHARHEGADLWRGVEFPGALAAPLGELADEVFVALADDVGLDVIEPEALGADGLDEVGEAVIAEVALAVSRGVEVHAVDDALQERVFSGDGPHVGGDALADLIGEFPDEGPDGLLGILRRQREEKADELGVGMHQRKGLPARADFLGDAVQFVIEDVAEALREDEREDVVFVFRRVLGPANGRGGIPDPGFEGFVFFGRWHWV